MNNFREVDSKLLRSAQITPEDIPELSKLGIKTVINLRNDPQDWESGEVTNVKVQYLTYPMSGWNRPNLTQVNRVLDAIFISPEKVLVHCEHGDDRTGVICACYRIRSGWSNEAAEKEARSDGLSWVELAMKDFIEDYRA